MTKKGSLSLPTHRVFISCTSVDLADYRAALAETIRLMDHHAVVMEHFGAQNGDATKVSTREVARSDIFVLLVAWRYGHVPRGQTKSVTHLEYEEAARRGLPRLVFLADPITEGPRGADALFPDAGRDAEHRDDLLAFRDALMHEGVVAKFTTPESLVAQVVPALYRVLREQDAHATQPRQTVPAADLAADEWRPPMDVAVLPLPPRASGLVGREREQRWLLDRLLQARTAGVWAFEGMGGVGKTCLVADLLPAVTSEFAGGIGVIRANEVTDPYVILRQLVEKFVPSGAELLERGAMTKAALSSRLTVALTELWARGRRVLVAIDNVEADLIPKLKPLLDGLQVAHASVVITAREELDHRLVAPEDCLELSVFPAEVAVELFIRLVVGHVRTLSDAERADVAAICEIAGNHAQALVLAAADLQERAHLTVTTYRRHLEDAPDAILDLYDRLSAETPNGVRLTFSSSYDHLDAATQQLFVALGALAGPSCAMPAVVALGGALGLSEEQTLASLDRLLRAKLVRRGSALAPGTPARVELHPLVQQFARELLDAEPLQHSGSLRGALAQHYVEWTAGRSEDALRADDANLIAALDWASRHRPERNALLATLACNLSDYWKRRLQFDRATTWLPLALEALAELGPDWRQRRADLAHALAAQYYGGGRTTEAKQYYQASLALYREIGDKQGEGLALHSLGILAMHTGEPGASEKYLKRSLSIRRRIRDEEGQGQALSSLGFLALDHDPAAAKGYLTESLAIRRKLGDRRNEAITLRALGNLARDLGDAATARDYYTESLNIFRKLQFRRDEAITLQYLGVFFRNAGDAATAKEYYADSLEILEELDDRKNKIASLYGLGFVYTELDEPAKARHYFEKSIEVCDQVGDRRSTGITLRGLGVLAEQQGDLDRAEARYRESIAASRDVSDLKNLARACQNLGMLLLARQDDLYHAEGRALLEQVAALHRKLGRESDALLVEQEAARLTGVAARERT